MNCWRNRHYVNLAEKLLSRAQYSNILKWQNPSWSGKQNAFDNKSCWRNCSSTTSLFLRSPPMFSEYSPGSRSSWQRYWEVLRVTTTTRCLRMSSFVGIWKVMCVLEMRQYCWTNGFTVFTQRFLKYTLERERKDKRQQRETTKRGQHQLLHRSDVRRP